MLFQSGGGFGFIVDDKPDLQVGEILEQRLFLGSQDVAADFELLKSTGEMIER